MDSGWGRWVLVPLAALAILVFQGRAQAQEVGKFIQVENKVDHLKKGQETGAPAKVQGGVENQDLVRTAEKSRARLQFIDETTMQVAPKSKVTIEDYMYDAKKGKRHAVIQVIDGAMETVVPKVAPAEQPDFLIKTTTAIAGIRGTKYITLVKKTPDGKYVTLFYVNQGLVRVRTYCPDMDPGKPTMRYVADSIRKGTSLKDVVIQGLGSGLDPCALIKAMVVLGMNLDQLVKQFMAVCPTDPKLKDICTPCVILKCAVEAYRCMKEADVKAGMYSLLLSGMAPILDSMKPGDWEKAEAIVQQGVGGDIPGYPPSADQLEQAADLADLQKVFDALAGAGANLDDLRTCAGGMGLTLTYEPPGESTVPGTSPTYAGSGKGQPATPTQ